MDPLEADLGGDRWQGTCSYVLAGEIVIWARVAVFSEPRASLPVLPGCPGWDEFSAQCLGIT